MRMLMIVLTAVASVLVPRWAEATTVREPGQQFIKLKKTPNAAKDYYVVPKGESGKCVIVTGDLSDKPVGAVGDAPYAEIKYAMKALQSSPKCKGGLADDSKYGDRGSK